MWGLMDSLEDGSWVEKDVATKSGKNLLQVILNDITL